MFALAALILFLLSPFIGSFGPWQLVTLGLACLALQMLTGWAIPWGRIRGNPPA